MKKKQGPMWHGLARFLFGVALGTGVGYALVLMTARPRGTRRRRWPPPAASVERAVVREPSEEPRSEEIAAS